MKKKFNRKEKAIVQDFVNSINSSLAIKISENKRFECDIPKNTIYLGLKTIDEDELELFNEWLSTHNVKTKMNRRILSLLHEIGHFQTFNKEEWEDRNKREQVLIFLYDQDIISYKQLNFSYWNLTNELKATMWGVNYYKRHKKQCEELAAMLGLEN